ncbi:CpXC domain-containing protein [Zhaonella formicivorans]|uniref:CpXC domain-containing protein n=1 Tax=Zhaonella formicivorans TaxID=2528593 RepID=UPI0010E49AF2|nr:CpXC domain-containing protein [Zhaonella formicivorans]
MYKVKGRTKTDRRCNCPSCKRQVLIHCAREVQYSVYSCPKCGYVEKLYNPLLYADAGLRA